tara:strand:+ start:8890 stop:9336 length:447 start_codon:yes stop_codon:yes gene_type:complete
LKKITSLLAITSLIFFISCNKTNNIADNNIKNIKYLNGYWEISKVTKNSQVIKNYDFNGTVDFYFLDDKNQGYRKKVKPRINGSFEITMHQMMVKIKEDKKNLYLVYGKNEEYSETLVKLDSSILITKNNDGRVFEYKRFYPKNFLNE